MGYWELREGKDCVKKTWITTKVATVLGLVGTTYHIVGFQPDSAMAALKRATNGTVTMAQSFTTGASACLTLGTIAYIAKYGKMDGWQFMPPRKDV
ncbi:hypothetical protein CRUP_006801 [Coryphaenoides rupestris]|nr:hypothetical protein CRUP_006801 [Coryphaenoides rupestris]